MAVSDSTDALLLRLSRKCAGKLRAQYPPGFTFDDAVSEAYILARKAKQRYDLEKPPHPEALWMNVRVVNDLKDRFAVLRRQSREFARGNDEALRKFDPAETVPMRSDLRDALQYLTEPQRDVVAAVYFNGLTQEEAAEERGVTQEAVSQMLTRAFDTLKEKLGADYLDPN